MNSHEIIKCDDCKDVFSIYDMKIFSESEDCTPFTEIKNLCDDCYDEYIKKKIESNGTSVG